MSIFKTEDVVVGTGGQARPLPVNEPPAQVLSITGTGSPQSVSHTLKDSAGRAAVPRAYRLLQFNGVAMFQVNAQDDKSITVTVSNGGTIELALYV